MSRNLPANIPNDKVEDIYKQELTKISENLIDQIYEFIKRPLGSSVVSAQIVVFPDEYCDQTSSVWIYFEGKNKRIDHNDPNLFAGKSLELFNSFTSLPTLDIDEYEELDFPNMLVDLIIHWFAESWWKAGGWYYQVPVEILGSEGFGWSDTIQLTKIKS